MIKSHLKRVLIGGVLGLSAAATYWKLSPRIYEGTAQVFINTSNGGKQSDDTATILQLALSQSAVSEGAILRSEGTFKQAVFDVAQAMNKPSLASPDVMDDLFTMYDVQMMRDSRVMTVRVQAYDAKVAAAIANQVVDVYNRKRRQTASAAWSTAQSSVNDQLGSAKQALDKSEQKIKEFKEKSGLLDTNTVSQITGYMATLNQERVAAKTEENSLRQEIALGQAKISALPKLEESSRVVVKNPVYDQLEMQVSEYEKQRIELLRVYTPTSTKVKQIDDLIAATRKRMADAKGTEWQQNSHSYQLQPIRAELEQQLTQNQIRLVSNQARQRSIAKISETQNALANTLPAKERELAQLQRDHDVFQANYMRLKAQEQDFKLKGDSTFQPAVNLYPADAAQKPVFPQASKILPLGLLAGGILGLLFGFIRESMRSTARTSEELSTLFELPVVATVPALPEVAVRKKLQSMAERKHIPQESFRFMASATALSKNGPKRVIFTSSGGNVGCSSAAAEFAVAAAKMGIKTILIDADTTFGTVTKAFKMKDKPGLRDILGQRLLASGDTPLALPTNHPHLSLLPIGTDVDKVELSDAPKGLLQGLLDSLQEDAEMIVLDCPPIDVVADTSRFVPLVDEICLVVSARRTSLQSISLARALLERCGAKTISVILTAATPKEEAFTDNNRYLIARR